MRLTAPPIALALFGLLLGGCDASCTDACKKLIDECEAGIPSYNVTQCETDCNGIQDEYESEVYLEEEAVAFQEQLNCIQKASCDDLLEGEESSCYQEATGLYIFN